MKQLKKICMISVIVLFAMNVAISSAFAVCNCLEMQDKTMQMDNTLSNMPCHEANQAKAGPDASSDDNQMADCDQCDCGYCATTTSAALANQLLTQVVTANLAALLSDDFMKSLFSYGIDYPPKPIS